MDRRSFTIALMHYAGPPGIGGVETTLAAHAQLLHAAGHRVRLLVGQGSAPAPGIDVDVILALHSRGLQVEAVQGRLAAGIVLVQAHQLLEATPLLLLPARVTRRKNIELAIAIVGAMRQQGATPRLLITGPPGPHNPTNRQYPRELEALQASCGAAQAVVFLYRSLTHADGTPRRVSERMLADCYRLADALLFPSWSEGFGLPIIEAGLVGLPIFCSDIPPFREIAGEAAFYFNPAGEPSTIAQEILQALAADRRTQLRQRVRQTFSWETICTNHLVPLLNAAVGRAR